MEKNTLKALQQCPLFEGFTAKDIEQMMDNIPYRLVRFEKKELFLSWSQFGDFNREQRPSPFLSAIPRKYVRNV